MEKLNWYEFEQNNSGGSFVVNDKLCHRIFIQAESEAEAISIAEDFGCYWNGVENGMDCPCCGDRWSCYTHAVDIERYCNEGYETSFYGCTYENPTERWYEKYGKYEIAERPAWDKRHGVTSYRGKIKFHNIAEYAQYLADDYGCTAPDARIYYKDGSIKEIFSNKLNNI